jgi:hypothetical protein
MLTSKSAASASVTCSACNRNTEVRFGHVRLARLVMGRGTETFPTEVTRMPTVRENAKPAQAWPHPAHENEEERRWTRAVMGGSAGYHTRRAAVRLLAVGALTAPAALRSGAARAIKGWCRRDPIVKIGDVTAHIVLSSHDEMNKLATGASRLVITVPEGVPTRFVASDPGFGHFGYDVRFVESPDLIANYGSIEVQVEAHTPAANPRGGPLPLLLTFTALGRGRPASDQAEGQANEWLLLRANLAVRDFAPPPKEKKGKDKGKDKGRGK